MRILIYKRTHRGDPDANGIFGIDDCMGSVRNFRYDAVIGVGGIGDDPQAQDIAGKVTWVGIGPRRLSGGLRRGPLVVFRHFVLYDTYGSDFRTEAPILANRIYNDNVRLVISGLSKAERAEALNIVAKAYSAPPSPGRFHFSFGFRSACSTRLHRQTKRCSKRSASLSRSTNSNCRR